MRDSSEPSLERDASAIADCVVRILAPRRGEEPVTAARELAKLGVWARRGTRPRGTMEAAARCVLPDPTKETELLRRLSETEGELRRQIMSALSQWGGEASAVAIAELLPRMTTRDDLGFCIASLETIGGPTAVDALRWAADRADLRDTANYGLEQLATGGIWDYSEGVPIPLVPAVAGTTKQQIDRLEQNPERRIKLREIASKVPPSPGVSQDQRLIELADEERWPRWAVESLPTPLIVQLPDSKCFLWQPIARLARAVNGHRITSLEKRCAGVIELVEIDPWPDAFFELVKREIDLLRMENPYPSDRSMIGVLADGLESIECVWKGQPEFTEKQVRLDEFRRQIERENGLPCK